VAICESPWIHIVEISTPRQLIPRMGADETCLPLNPQCHRRGRTVHPDDSRLDGSLKRRQSSASRFLSLARPAAIPHSADNSPDDE
jgi:hypothetical protein